MRRAAFFDMDRTLLAVNSATLWVRYARRRGELSLANTVMGAVWLLGYHLAVVDMDRIVRKVVSGLAGQSEAELREKALAWFEAEVSHHVRPAALARVDEHRAKDDLVSILSSSSPYATEPLARQLGIEHVLCTRPEVQDGRFTGRVVEPVCDGAGKVGWAERFAAEQEVDLAESTFYTDSFNDLPMLKRVGRPVVVNPDPRLARHARRVGWPIEKW